MTGLTNIIDHYALPQICQSNHIPSISIADAALRGLTNGNVQPLVQLLESYFTPLSIRAVLYLNESALQTILEAFWFEPSKHGCITQLCLLADPAGGIWRWSL
jgi:hypothetical protein